MGIQTRSIPLLAVDGGATKVVAVFTDEQGNILGKGQAGSCNYQSVGLESAAQELGQAIAQAKAELRTTDEDTAQVDSEANLQVEVAVLGVAGVDTELDRQIVAKMVQEVLAKHGIEPAQLLIENDGFAALVGATDGGAGVLLIAGTGSIAFGVDQQGRTARAGGWGHLVGDEGSGYWIGKQAITAVLKALDGREQPTVLSSLIIAHLGLADIEALYNWTYGSLYRVEKVAGLAPLVGQAAEQGDRVALELLEQAAVELAAAAIAVVGRLGLAQQPFSLVLQGGILQHNARIRESVARQMSEYAPQVQLDQARREPLYGVIAQGLQLLQQISKEQKNEAR